jgi:6-hydroxycyclohex-1-ene-1-carbonyl-CoA dehydrogenase
MKAIRLLGANQPLAVCDLPTPRPGDDEVLVRVAACGVCHTDIGFWREGVPTRHPLPLTLGHEIAGTVEAAGAAWTGLVGREVVVPAVIPCGNCGLCAGGRGNVCRNQKMPGNDIDGGFAEYVVVPGHGVCPVDDRGCHPLEHLSVVADAVSTAYQAVVRSGLGAGDLAIVVGAGGVGIYTVQIAAAFGAAVVAIDVDQGRLAAAAAHGAGLTLNSAGLDLKSLRQRIRDQSRSWGSPDYGWKIFECSGHPAGQQTAFGLLTYAASLLVVGFTLSAIEVRLSNAMAFDATIQGTWGCRLELYPAALRLVTSGRVALAPFVTTFPMSRGPEVLARVADHEIASRAILVPDWTV